MRNIPLQTKAGVGKFEDGEGHYISTLTPEGPHCMYCRIKNSRFTSSKHCIAVHFELVDRLFLLDLNFPTGPTHAILLSLK